MDIWRWVSSVEQELKEQGHDRLADLIDELPSAVVDDDIAKVDAIYPEALALARNQPHPWVEIFIRHWNLQSRVLRRDEGQGQLEEAIQLLDYASQESTKDCPQAICVVQDLASCYENIDPIGYANERLAVANETLARINPAWSCYACITTEALGAKKSLKRYDEVLEDIQQARKAIRKADPDDQDIPFVLMEAEVLSKKGQFTAAIQLLQKVQRSGGGEHFERCRKITMSAVYARSGDYDKALEYLLPFNEIVDAMSLGHDWCEVCFELAMHGKIENNWRLHHYFEQLCQKWLALGCVRYCFDHTVKQAKLALKRSQKASVQTAVVRLRELLPQLRVDAGAAAELTALSCLLEELPDPELKTNDVDGLLESLPEDPEQRLGVLNAGLEQWPDNQALATAKIVTLNLLERESDDFAEQFLRDYPNSTEVLASYGFGQPDLSFLQALGESALAEDTRMMLHWVIGHQHRAAEAPALALAEYQAILALKPHAKNTLGAAASMSLLLKQYSQAMDYCQQLILLDEEDDAPRWDLLVAATLAGAWQEVRKQACILGMEVEEGDEVIREQWSWARIAWPDEDEMVNYPAIRTGPVTAQITGSSEIGRAKTYHAEVVFDPCPINQLSETDEDGNAVDAEGHDTFLYAMIDEIDSGKDQWSRYDLEGVYPGDDDWDKLLNDLDDLGIHLLTRSSRDYVIGLEGEFPAFYAYLMVPCDMSLPVLNQHLLAITAELEHPLIWPLVAYLSGDHVVRERAEGIAQQYEISSNDYAGRDPALLS